MTYDFTLILNEQVDEGGADKLYAVIDDGSIISDAGISRIEFDRESTSLQNAIASALADVLKAGFTVSHIQPCHTFKWTRPQYPVR
jgi:hypothetical protein